MSDNQGQMFSKIALGFWRLLEWKKSKSELEHFIRQVFDFGISTFDHADIYGNYACEEVFGHAFSTSGLSRTQVQLVTKTGIKLVSDRYPERKIKTYDTNYAHIVHSVENSLRKLKTDYLDAILIHRPDPWMDYSVVSRAFQDLIKSGKVLSVGVSNFSREDLMDIERSLSMPISINQLEFSAFQLEHLERGNLSFLQSKNIRPMFWSPLGGGVMFKTNSTLRKTLEEVAREEGFTSHSGMLISWLLSHPSRGIPILGSGNISHIEEIVKESEQKLSRESIYKILVAAKGSDLP